MIEHLCSCYGFGKYQCIYCQFGANDFKIIDDHIAWRHSSQLPIFCERVLASGFDLENAKVKLRLFLNLGFYFINS